jgi:hypothetical protein
VSIHTHHNIEHNAEDHEDPTAGPLWIVGVCSCVIFIAVFFALTALFYQVDRVEFGGKVESIENQDRQVVIEAQAFLRNQDARWVEYTDAQDQTQQRLEVPIDHAIGTIVQQYGAADNGKGTQKTQ